MKIRVILSEGDTNNVLVNTYISAGKKVGHALDIEFPVPTDRLKIALVMDRDKPVIVLRLFGGKIKKNDL